MNATISDIKVTPLALPLKKPYVWSRGVLEHFTVNLIEVIASDGTVGIGECSVGPDQTGTLHILNRLIPRVLVIDVFWPNLWSRLT